MAELTPIPPVRHPSLIFPETQYSPEKKAQGQSESEALYERCKIIFDRLQPELTKTHYNSYIAIEPDNETYIIEKDKMIIYQKIRQTYPNTKNVLFRINETGVSGTI